MFAHGYLSHQLLYKCEHCSQMDNRCHLLLASDTRGNWHSCWALVYLILIMISVIFMFLTRFCAVPMIWSMIAFIIGSFFFFGWYFIWG